MATDPLAAKVGELETKFLTFNKDYSRIERYINSEYRPEALGLAVPPELEYIRTVLGWPRLVIEALAERLNLIGFRTSISDLTNNELDRIWRANNMREMSTVAHKEAFGHGRAFICVGPNAKDPKTPLITVESSRYMYVETDPRTGDIVAALRLFGLDDKDRTAKYATLYLENETHFFKRTSKGWQKDREPFRHNMDQVPVFQLTNRMSLAQRDGISEIADVIGLVDMACRTLTNLGAAVETLSFPQNWVLGATDEDFMDDEGDVVGPQIDARMGRLQILMNENAKIQQLSAADLTQLISVINMLAKSLAAVTGLPVHYLGVTSEVNPTSADAIRSSEARHVKRAEDRINSFGAVWSRVMEFAAKLAGLSVEYVEVQWANPATPTDAQQADAVVKLLQTKVIPVDFARRKLGYTPAEIEEMNMLEGNDPLSQLVASLSNEEVPDNEGS